MGILYAGIFCQYIHKVQQTNFCNNVYIITMSTSPVPIFNNPSIEGKEDRYETITVDLDKVLASWKQSLFSFEWLLPDGSVRSKNELSENERQKYDYTLSEIESGNALPQPILGIGMMGNIEIGSKREILLTLYSKGVRKIDVHILKQDFEEFKSYKI